MAGCQTKAEAGTCINRLCRAAVEPGQERCAPCAKEWAKRSAPCKGCGANFTRKPDQPYAKFCCKACWVENIGRMRAAKKRQGAARFRPPGASSVKLHESACRCGHCVSKRFEDKGARADLINRVAQEMGVPVSPLAGIPIAPLTQEQFAAKWDRINGALRKRNREVWWRE